MPPAPPATHADPATGRRRRAALLPAAALVLAAAFASHAFGEAGEPGLRRLAERLVATWGEPGQMRTSLHVGSLPEALLIELPLPASFGLLGSLARFEREGLLSLEVVLDGPARTAEAFDLLRSSFEGAGWLFLADSGLVGFVHEQLHYFGRACPPAAPEGFGAHPVAHLRVSPLPQQPSDVRIDFMPHGWEGSCIPATDAGLERFAPLPALIAPAGSRLSNPLVSYGADDAAALAVLHDAPGLAAVADHYAGELTALGWTRVPGGQRDQESERSRWTVAVAERPWIGLLAVERPGAAGPLVLSFTLLPDAP